MLIEQNNSKIYSGIEFGLTAKPQRADSIHSWIHRRIWSVTGNPPISEASPMQGALRDKHYLRKHGENAYYGQKGGSI